MLNDQEVSELISKSIRTELSEQETEMVNEHLSENQKSRAFARISRLIQSSLADIAVLSHDGDESIGPGLSGRETENEGLYSRGLSTHSSIKKNWRRQSRYDSRNADVGTRRYR